MNNYNFTVKGNGREILLVHGWGGNISSLENLQTKLSETYKVYNLELPGHGISNEMDTPWEMKDFRNFIVNFIHALNLKKIIYIGHSFGGKIGIETALNTDVIDKLILVDASGIKPKNSLKKFFWKGFSLILKPITNSKFVSPLRSLFYRFIIREKDYLKTKGNLKETFKKIVNSHYDKEIRKIKAKTLIVWGINDMVTPMYMAKTLHEKISNSTLLVLEGTHSLPLKKADTVSETILNWLQD